MTTQNEIDFSLFCDQLAMPSLRPWDFAFYRLSFPLAATEAVHYAHLSRDPLHQPNGTGRISRPNKILQYTLKNYLQMYPSSEGVQWVSLYGATWYRKCIIPLQIQTTRRKHTKRKQRTKAHTAFAEVLRGAHPPIYDNGRQNPRPLKLGSLQMLMSTQGEETTSAFSIHTNTAHAFIYGRHWAPSAVCPLSLCCNFSCFMCFHDWLCSVPIGDLCFQTMPGEISGHASDLGSGTIWFTFRSGRMNVFVDESGIRFTCHC